MELRRVVVMGGGERAAKLFKKNDLRLVVAIGVRPEGAKSVVRVVERYTVEAPLGVIFNL